MIEFINIDEMWDIDYESERCYRVWDINPIDPGWICVNDNTGCLYNDGHNTCFHEGASLHPLEDEE